MLGTPYSDEMIDNAMADFAAQADPDSDYDGLLERYGDNVNVRNFDDIRKEAAAQAERSRSRSHSETVKPRLMHA